MLIKDSVNPKVVIFDEDGKNWDSTLNELDPFMGILEEGATLYGGDFYCLTVKLCLDTGDYIVWGEWC